MKTIKLALFTAVLMASISCSQSTEGNKIGDAQFCLDKLATTATSAEVDACLANISGITTTAAESVRCGAQFQREGFTNPQTFIDAMTQATNGAATSMMNVLAFHSAGAIATDDANASSAFSSCVASGGKAATLLSAFSYIGTNLYKHYAVGGAGATACGTSCSATPNGTNGVYNVDTCLTSAGSVGCLTDLVNPAGSAVNLMTVIGTIAIGTKTVSCSGTSSANTALCTMINDAVTSGGAANAKCVGYFFFKTLIGASSIAATCPY